MFSIKKFQKCLLYPGLSTLLFVALLFGGKTMNSGFIILAKVNICPTFHLIPIFNVLISSSFPRRQSLFDGTMLHTYYFLKKVYLKATFSLFSMGNLLLIPASRKKKHTISLSQSLYSPPSLSLTQILTSSPGSSSFCSASEQFKSVLLKSRLPTSQLI